MAQTARRTSLVVMATCCLALLAASRAQAAQIGSTATLQLTKRLVYDVFITNVYRTYYVARSGTPTSDTRLLLESSSGGVLANADYAKVKVEWQLCTQALASWGITNCGKISIGGTYLCKATDTAPVNGNCNTDNAAVWGVTKVNGEAVLYVQDKNSADSSPGRRCMAYTPEGRKQGEIAMPLTGNWYNAAYSSGACRYTIQSCTGDCDF